MIQADERLVALWPHGPVTRAWRLRSNELALTVTEFGAHVVDIAARRSGNWQRISVDYPGSGPAGCHGATVGRWANRIAGSSFELDGRTHRLEANEGRNQLHGGPRGFHLRPWSGRVGASATTAHVHLALVSPDGDQGFPGTVEASAVIGLEGSSISIVYEATSDRATPLNLTSHIYWNLAGGGPLHGHHITVAADRCVMVDSEQIPVPGPAIDVTGTRFDLRDPTELSDIVSAGGYDHCFLLRPDGQRAIRLEHDNGLAVTTSTDQPGVQIYTGQHLDPNRRGVAIEPQRIPDTPNRPDLGEAFLWPGDRYRSSMRFDVAP